MPDVTATTEQSFADRERRAQRALGAIANEVKHLEAQVAEHTATIRELNDDRRSIKQKFEAIDRDLSATPKVPMELLSTFSASIAQLTQRLERLEATVIDKKETTPPKRRDEDQKGRRDENESKRHGDREGRKPPNPLDSWF